MNSGLEQAIGHLLRVLRARSNPVAGNLLPGIDPDVQRRLAEAEDLDLDPELVAWYSLIGGLTARGEQYDASLIAKLSGADADRTRYPVHAMDVLYQLSYGPLGRDHPSRWRLALNSRRS